MRIVDVCAFYAPRGGGVKTYVERKLQAGAEAGHEVIILAPSDRSETVRATGGGRIVMLPARRFPLDRRYHYFDNELSLHQALDHLKPDLVEASSPWSSASMVARWRGDAPRALIMHADPLSAYAYRWFGSFASRGAIDRGFDWFWRHLRRLDMRFDLVVSASESLSIRLRQGGLRHVATLPMGVEPGYFSPALRDAALRAQLLGRCGLRPDATLLIGVGRHAPEKRWPLVIDAVTTAGYQTPVGLVLVGDGRERQKVRRAAANNPHIQLLAPINDRPQLARLLASADALVHGCEAETFCMVGAEAAASGLPLIMPDQGGAADHAAHYPNLRYAAGQADALAAAILSLAQDRAARAAEAVQAAAHVRTMDDHFAALFSAYGQMKLEQRHAA